MNTLKTSKGEALVPYEVIRDSSISIEARGLYALLATHSKGWVFYRQDIIKKCGCSKHKYDRMRRELVDAGYLSILPVRDEGRIVSYEWSIKRQAKDVEEEVPIHLNPKNQHTANQYVEVQPLDNSESENLGHLRGTNNKVINKKNIQVKEKQTKKSRKRDIEEQLESCFSDFWSSDVFKKAVPSQCRPNPELAFNSALKALVANKDLTPEMLFTSIIGFYSQKEVLNQRKENKDNGRSDGKYIKHLTTMLNQNFYKSFLDGNLEVKSKKSKSETSDARFDIALNAWVNGGSWDSFSFGPEPNTEKNRKLSKITDEQYKKYLAAKEEKSSSRP